jgi:uncharacterized protein (TIGR02646 family)
MRYIIKAKEPEALRLYRTTTPNATYDGFSAKKEIRESLLEEQKRICAYCMQRISEDRDEELNKYKTEIEHYKSQDEFPELALDYKNMLAVCNGNQGNPEHLLHCDKSKDTEKNKKHLPLSVNPLFLHSIEKIKYQKDGEIYSDDETINQDLNKLLNLNQQTLKQNRKNVIDAVYEELERRHVKNTPWKISIVQKLRDEWDAEVDGTYKPFCQAAIYHLDRILKKLSKQ